MNKFLQANILHEKTSWIIIMNAKFKKEEKPTRRGINHSQNIPNFCNQVKKTIKAPPMDDGA